MRSSRASVWRVASERLQRARETDWSNPISAESVWARLGEAEARLLVPARHVDDLKDKLAYLLQLSEPPPTRGVPTTDRSLKLKLLHSALKDVSRIAEQSESNERFEAVRRHAATLGPADGLTVQVSKLRRELMEMRAERDAAYRALERSNGVIPVERGYSSAPSTHPGVEIRIHG